MKRIFLLIVPVILIMLAFRPVNSHTVSGTVTDEKGNPLSSVNVKYKGTRQGTFTDATGKYSITISSSTGSLIFSALGYETIEMKISGKSVIDIAMKTETKVMNEVVVIGHGQGQAKKVKTLGNANQAYSSPVSSRGLYDS
jgi:Ca-activated chloride channel family protein